jgi:hypothetical protein
MQRKPSEDARRLSRTFQTFPQQNRRFESGHPFIAKTIFHQGDFWTDEVDGDV